MPSDPTAPLTDHAIGDLYEAVGENLDARHQRTLALVLDEREAVARHREQADAEVARLKAAIPEDPWAWLSRRQPGHARCYACDASWSLSQGHEPDCAWLATRPPTPSPEQGA